ncbi:maleylpyruvate isomerase N-terminal domain-containing protein, partial [Streptomyces broussonetiae]
MNQSPAPLPLATDVYLATLREKAAALEQLLRIADPATPVATCGSWSMHDLGIHLGQASRFAAALLQTGQLPREQFAPPAGQGIADWYAGGAAAILATLEETDPTAPAWAFGFEGTMAALWFRRVAQDTAVHLVDAQLA